MTENDVIVLVTRDREKYEEKTGLPRHEENLANFGVIFGWISKAKGFAIACTVFIGLPGVVASMIVIIKTIRGH